MVLDSYKLFDTS